MERLDPIIIHSLWRRAPGAFQLGTWMVPDAATPAKIPSFGIFR